ncbi:hypothetical protein C1X34_20190 [Pseudomonas sp. GW456-12-10-14-TSB6]|nr:hypothetical protein C1X55_17790 [Pseudomonas sp. GW460-C8]PMW17197.1 hypothetical protein C1X40_17810 [Pseudomonas sp. GW456-11-11-14-TSB2]PMW21106.1 hypothetical protein C1X53_16930 [Pseudomonas sp. GW456-E6]PMW33607.1 hypothetical protein C1X48_22310 [Pseudomonas sp. FW305-3-2-15-A-R2A1]PMW36590.1 hypothetical protein C1X45_15180 [Pseudomonas sp. GW460-7]PMW57463.1 hypothetical protein C1X39_20065 [Pseudomonas sp. GW456-12-1-14-TSB1]PMW66561.1 hypothetical protein C1X31_07170 [Pseudomon
MGQQRPGNPGIFVGLCEGSLQNSEKIVREDFRTLATGQIQGCHDRINEGFQNCFPLFETAICKINHFVCDIAATLMDRRNRPASTHS